MRLVPVKTLPKKKEKRSHRKDLEKLLADFMASKDTIVRCEFDSDEYAQPIFCRASLDYAVQRYKYPIAVCYRSEQVYLVKKDIL